MPALPPVPDVIRIDLKFKYGEDVSALNRFFMIYTSAAPTNVQLDTFAGNVINEWDNQQRHLYVPDVTLETVEVTDLSSPSSAQASVDAGHAGTRAPGSNTAGSSAVLKFIIPRRYRGGHPRMYTMAGNTADLASPQSWSGAFLAELTADWTAFINAILTHQWAAGGPTAQVNVSYFEGFHLVTPPSGRTRAVPTRREAPLVDGVSSIGANPHVGSQRRRDLQQR